MPIRLAPDFIPQRAQPLQSTDFTGTFLDAAGKAQALRNAAIMAQIEQQMAPLKIRGMDLENQMNAYKLSELNDPRVRAYKDATMQKAISDMGVIPTQTIQGQQALPALPVSDAIKAEVPVDTSNGKTGVEYDNTPLKDQTIPIEERPVPLRDGSIADPVTAYRNRLREIQLDAIKKQMENPFKEIPAGGTLVDITKVGANGQPQTVYTSPVKQRIEAVHVGTNEAPKFFDLPDGQSLPDGWVPKDMAVGVTGKDGKITFTPKGDPAAEARENSKQLRLLGKYEANPQVKSYRLVKEQYDGLNAAYDQAKRSKNYVAADQAIIDTYNQIINPRRGVTTAMFNNTGKFQSALNKLYGWAEKNFTGGSGLTDSDRENIMEVAKRLVDVNKKAAKEQAERFRNMGADESMLDDFGDGQQPSEAPWQDLPGGGQFRIVTPQ